MLRQGHAEVSPCGAGKLRRETPAKTLQDPWFPKPWKCQLAAEHLKVWEAMLGAKIAGSPWSIKRPMTHQQLEATDVGKSAGCLNPRGSTSSCRKQHLTGKHGKKQWEKQLGSASGHVAPRVKSRFAVGGSALRSSPKMLKTRPLPTTAVFRACGPSREMCQ